MWRDFLLGEEKWLEFKVRPHREGDTLVITGASYVLRQGNDVTETGDCEIAGTVVRALIGPPMVGVYTFELTVTVPPETIKERVMVRVS